MTTNQRDRRLIEHLMRVTGMTPSAIARQAGLATTTLTRVMSADESRLSPSSVERLRGQFPALLGQLGEIALTDTRSFVEIDVLSSYHDGHPDRILLPVHLIQGRLRGEPSDFALIEVRGDSMIEAGFLSGDQLLVDRRDRDPAQPGPFAILDDNAYVVKILERVALQKGFLRIFSANDRYRDYQIEETKVNILGRPVWLNRAL